MSSLESIVGRFAFLEGSFLHLYNEFPKIKEGSTIYSFKSTVRELALIKLWAFLKVRKELLEILTDTGRKEKVDESLKPLWEPIYQHKEGIRLLRNKYLAHMQEEETPFEKTIEQIVYETKIAMTWKDIAFYCGCGYYYCGFIKANFQTEFESGREKYLKSIPLESLLPQSDIKHVQNTKKELNESLKTSIQNLETNGLQFKFLKPKSWSLSYESK